MVGLLRSRCEAIVDACARHRVARLEVFGSALRDDFKSDESDLDFHQEPLHRAGHRAHKAAVLCRVMRVLTSLDIVESCDAIESAVRRLHF